MEKKIRDTIRKADDRVEVVGCNLTSLGYVVKYKLEGIKYQKTITTIHDLNNLYQEISKL